MESVVHRAVLRASSSLSVRRQATRPHQKLQPLRLACALHSSASKEATPVHHHTVPGPPPQAPRAAVSSAQERVARKRHQADLLKKGKELRTNPEKPTSILKKRFWKDVLVKDTPEGLQVHLDTRPVRLASRQVLNLPHHKRALAASIAAEWDQLVSAQQALKHHYIPLTSLTSRAVDIEAADHANDPAIRDAMARVLMRYLATDTLLCWAPERNIHDPTPEGKKTLRQLQREAAEPITGFLTTQVFPGVEIRPILDADSIIPAKQPEATRSVIEAWLRNLPAFELAALERAVLATKSLLVASRLIVEWSPSFASIQQLNGRQPFGVEEAAKAATMEVMHQIAQWGEVEDSHDVEYQDVRRQLGSVVLLVS
ncbi:F1-ATP synthase assembly protein, protein [Acrodontium crateriforme]|uniref:F1-ATP synthase assembly protein, protein n=1 Tax=Acrodontium crateriforme TaxID=150365 RepID=A0AAQ3RBJ8_9PEZI|nr:F1-ATP synthase assembly protein, protein [Acrodontium crateriforme]